MAKRFKVIKGGTAKRGVTSPSSFVKRKKARGWGGDNDDPAQWTSSNLGSLVENRGAQRTPKKMRLRDEKALSEVADEIGEPGIKGPKFGRGSIGSKKLKKLLEMLKSRLGVEEIEF